MKRGIFSFLRPLRLLALRRKRHDSHYQSLLPPTLAPALAWSPCSPSSVEEAATLMLGQLRVRGRLRKKFRRALSDGRRGEFAQWIIHRLSDECRSYVEEAFDADPTAKIVDHFLHDYKLRKSVPNALLPQGRKALLGWLAAGGMDQLGLRPWQVLWFLQRSDEEAEYLEAVTRAVTPPGGALARPAGYKENLSEVREPLMAAVLRHRDAVPTGPGVNIFGHFTFCSGLQRSALLSALAIGHAAMPIRMRNIPVLRDRQEGLHASWFLDAEDFPTSLLHLTPAPFYRKTYERCGLTPREGVHRIGHMAWELPTLPESWQAPWDFLDEVWTYSDFVTEALRPYFRRVRKVLPCLPTQAAPHFGRSHFGRSHFGLPPDKYLILILFDLASSMERKNPQGAIHAFKQAVRKSDHAQLVIKVAHGALFPEQMAQLQDAARDAGARMLSHHLTEEEIHGLMNCCDAMLSLHRSEGFGFTLAEAMALSKPVIATGWSGNMEFMNPQNSFLVQSDLVPVGESCDVYASAAGALWAEPHVDHAASMIRRVLDDRDQARAVGLLAHDEVRRLLSVEACAAAMQQHILESQ